MALKLENYVIFLGIFDHKLGPICICPRRSCTWLSESWENPSSLIQDGLNTKASVLTIRNYEYIVQVRKFSIKDPRLRGGILRCCLFCIIPKKKSLLPSEMIKTIISGIKKLAKVNDQNPNSPECDAYLISKEDELNAKLTGEIGEGQTDHKRRELLTTIIGYSQLLLDGNLGDLNKQQRESVSYILAYANELLKIRSRENNFPIIPKEKSNPPDFE